MTGRARILRPLAGLLVLGLFAAACGGGPDDSSSPTSVAVPPTTDALDAPDPTAPATVPPTTGPAFDPAPITWEGCDDGLECGTLTVPLDPDDPTGATIGVAVARRAADDPDQRLGVLLVNPGGPAASGIDLLRRGLGLDEVAARFDLVSWDPRGTGASAPLQCTDAGDRFARRDAAPDDPGEQAALEAAAQEVTDDCSSLDGSLLPHVGTDTTVADLEVLRRALGEEQVSYLGFSYGTFIGLQYAEAHPDRVRAMVLDAVVDPALDLAGLAASQAQGVESALDRALAACAGSRCPLDDAAASFDAVAAQTEAAPLPAGGGTVGPAEVHLAGVYATYDESIWPSLWSALADAERGDGTGLAELADRYLGLVPYSPYTAVLCVDWPHPEGLEDWRVLADELETLAPRTGRAIANELLPCATWSAEPWRRAEAVTAAGAPPILVAGATGDAATPYASAQAVAAALESGVLLTHEHDGHVSTTRSTCVAGWVTDYLIDLTTPPEGTVC